MHTKIANTVISDLSNYVLVPKEEWERIQGLSLEDAEDEEWENDPKVRAILQKRIDDSVSGKSKPIPWEKVKKDLYTE